jgi:hypothetical protein
MTLIILLLIIYLFIGIFAKPSTKYTYCGIFAFNGPSGLSEDLWRLVIANMKILGMEMDSRGGDGSGILINNEVIHAKATERKFDKFLSNNILLPPTESSTLIGHCRKASVGGLNILNTHPIEIFENRYDADFKLAGVHNGTIKNWKQLMTDYKVTSPGLIDLDSAAMYEIIKSEPKKNITVFSKYMGGGVFVWYYADEPNALYLYKGASKDYKHAKVSDERPLFHYRCKVTNGIYFCSTEEALEKIAESHDDIKDTQINHVMRFVDGKFDAKFSYEVDRKDIVNSTVTTFANAHGCNDDYECDESRYAEYWDNFNKKTDDVVKHITTTPKSVVTVTPKLAELKDEKQYNQNYYKKRIYRDNHLYYKNGHLVKTPMYLDSIGNEVFIKDNVVPEDAKMYYFYEGILMSDEKAYLEYRKRMDTHYNINTSSEVSAQYTSKYTMYPIMDKYSKMFHFDGKIFTGTIKPPFADGKTYKFNVGKLVMIETKNVDIPKPKDEEPKNIIHLPILKEKEDPKPVVNLDLEATEVKLVHNFNSLTTIINEGKTKLKFDENKSTWKDDSLFENTVMWILPSILTMIGHLTTHMLTENGVIIKKEPKLF